MMTTPTTGDRLYPTYPRSSLRTIRLPTLPKALSTYAIEAGELLNSAKDALPKKGEWCVGSDITCQTFPKQPPVCTCG